MDQAVTVAQARLDAMQKAMFEKARAFREAHTFTGGSMEEMKARADDGFLLAQLCESTACEARVKEETGRVTSRNECVVCGSLSPGQMVWSKAY